MVRILKKVLLISFLLRQPQHRLIRGIFEKTLNYKDSIFYDITAWTMPLAFGLPYAELSATGFNQNLLGEKVSEQKMITGQVTGGKSEIAYLVEWSEFYSPAVLYELQNAGIITKVATNDFEMRKEGKIKKYNYGTILIPVAMQAIKQFAIV